MTTLTILVPVFFLLVLGYVSRVKGWLTLEQKNGANSLVFTIFFPILIFHLIATASFQLSTLSIIAYVLVMFSLAMLVGKWLVPFTGKDKAHFSPYLLTTVEGGSVALPLYLSIVGTSSLTVMFDLAGSIIAFFILPVLLMRVTAQATSFKSLLREVFSNSFVQAILLGLLANAIGLLGILEQAGFLAMYEGVMSYVTAPIASVILFGLGYDLYFQKDTLLSVLRLALVRIGFYLLVIGGFFLLFPDFMAEKAHQIGVVLYFMCPTGFAMPSLMAPAFRNEEDAQFSSTFISLYMLVTLTAYTLVVLFIA